MIVFEGAKEMKKTRSNKGFTLIELLIVVAIIGIIAAIAVPGLLRARMSGNEASAIGSLRAINSGQAAFSSSCASGAYATTLADLQLKPTGSTQGFISPDLSANGVSKSGYLVNLAIDPTAGTQTMTPTACVAATNMASSYFAEDHPVTIGGTGQRSFATDTRGTIFQDPAGATFATIPAGAQVVQ